ncbi:MAG: YbhB/YbcL family Raf kinase inhibitor-like protein [Candidatus Methanoplasma sp.]|jgi:Raf kinase inhibitor-like YbhB/YbcL family protein|nr:YbhB/YbcL family Raf kinase inhibitor-like protein [Candidatus Methanoplasma sp.]
MFIESTAVTDGIIADRFGAKGIRFTQGGMPSYSIPFEIYESPEDTVSFAVIFDDPDAVPACGFTWVHWLIADLKRTSVYENESITTKDYVQGVNSWFSCASDLSEKEATGYGGPDPPDGTHTYWLKVHALDTELGLEDGFRLNDLLKAMNGHVLAHAKLLAAYSPK